MWRETIGLRRQTHQSQMADQSVVIVETYTTHTSRRSPDLAYIDQWILLRRFRST